MKQTPLLPLILAISPMARAENIVFPPDAGVKNTKDHGASGNGVTDYTKAILLA
jgi:hypothetical protein